MTLPRPFLWAVLAILLADRLAYMFLASPLPDEGYYWLWGQHLDWSYYDHPPLQAWLLGLGAKIFGHSLFALRAPTLLSTAAVVWTIRWWTRRAGLDFLTTLVAALSIPMVFVLLEITFPDHLLIALLSLATIPAVRTLEGFAKTGRVPLRPLYTAALLIGLAGLTKYNAVLFALAVFATILGSAKLRPMLKSPHLYIAALVMLACLTPVFVWNLHNGEASFRYNLVDRLQTGGLSLRIWAGNLWAFLRDIFLFAGPFAIIALLRVPFLKASGMQCTLARAGVLTLAALVLILSAFTVVYIHWVIIAFIPVLPFLGQLVTTRAQLLAHLVYGTVLTTLFTVNFTLMPLFAPFGSSGYLPGLAQGWPEIAARVQAAKAETGADFVAASDYRNGSVLAFWLDDPALEVFSTRYSQFTLWRDESARKDQKAVILTDPYFPLSPAITARFETVTKLETLPVFNHGYKVAEYTIYLGQGYIPE